MKCYVVSSRLFVPGHIMRPFRLQQEREALQAQRISLEQQLANLPRRIAELQAQEDEALQDFQQFFKE